MHSDFNLADWFSTGIMGFWSFLGAAMRGGVDWRDPDGKFSPRLMAINIATALVLGQIANVVGERWGWEPGARCALASFVGYLGPAATMQLLRQRLLGAKANDVANVPAADGVKPSADAAPKDA